MMGITKLSRKHNQFFPTEYDIVTYLKTQRHYRISRSDIVRAFGIDTDRIDELKELLKNMRKKNKISKITGNFYRPIDEDGNQALEVMLLDPVTSDQFMGQIIQKNHPQLHSKIKIFLGKKRHDFQRGHKVFVKIKESPKKGRYGKIIHDIQEMIGLIEEKNGKFDIVPVNKKQRWLYHVANFDEFDLSHGDLVQFKLLPKDNELYKKDFAEVIKIIKNQINSTASISLIALEEHHIPYVFNEETIKETQNISEIFLDDKNRTNLEHLPFITIDPSDARDHDDAVYAHPLKETGGCVVYIAIADVCAYVKTGSPIDKTAYNRGNSVYLPDCVIPMLPETLSNDLCSLKANRRRPVLVVRIEFDSQGQKIKHDFSRATIKCVANYSYEDVFSAVKQSDSTIPIEHINNIINPLIAAYETLKIFHKIRQPLDLDLPEYKLLLDDLRRPLDVIKKERLFTHRLIEEFMIWANICAAETLEKHDMTFLYRSHETPPKDKVSTLREVLKTMDIPFKQRAMVTSEMFNTLLRKTKDTELSDVIQKMVLRCQCQAIYTTKNQGHFGLNLVKYAHFTSPIRRYADLIVHRALIKAVNLGQDGLTQAQTEIMPDIAEHISITERKAITAEMETKDRFLAEYLKPHIGSKFTARVSGVSNAGLFVKLHASGAEGFISISSLSQRGNKRKYFETDDTRLRLTDKYSGKYYMLGQIIHVILIQATPVTGGMVFEVVDDKDILKPAHNNMPKKNSKKKEKKSRS